MAPVAYAPDVAARPELDRVWARLDELTDRAPSVVDLLDHRLGAIAARHWRATGRELPPAIVEEERYAASAVLAVQVLLARVTSEYAGPVMVLKGPEVAQRYPDPRMRPSHDLDLLVEDSQAAFTALRAAGCDVVSDESSPQHELPLAFPDLPLVIELHSAPKWPSWAGEPPTRELMSTAVTSDGLLAPAPAQHAVLLAVHSWTHRPLARVLDLADVLVMLADADAREARELARRWRVERVWNATLAAAEALLGDGREPWTLRAWGRNTPEVRRPTRREELLERCLSPFAALPPVAAARVSGKSVVEMLRARAGRGSAHRLEDIRPEHPAIVAARERTRT